MAKTPEVSTEDVFGRMIRNIESVMKGQASSIRKLLAAFVSGGHVLLDDYPGTGKTTLAKCLARSIGVGFSRIQFTPDLLPSDILGVSIFDQLRSRLSVFMKGRSSPTSCWPTRSIGLRPGPAGPGPVEGTFLAARRRARPFRRRAREGPRGHGQLLSRKLHVFGILEKPGDEGRSAEASFCVDLEGVFGSRD